MPLYDFVCQSCKNNFEEISSPDEIPACPQCGSSDVKRNLSAPSPLQTGAFPYKVGPVHGAFQRPQGRALNNLNTGCPSGGCSGCSGK